MSDYSLGIMRFEADALDQFKREIYSEQKPYQSLASRIGELSADERADLVRIAKLVPSFQRAKVSASDGISDTDYMDLIEQLHRGLKPNLKVLLADVLNQIEPVKVIKPPKEDPRDALLKMYEEDERFKVPLPEYDLPIKNRLSYKCFWVSCQLVKFGF